MTSTEALIVPTLAFGIDIGGSGMKGAPVDLTTGKFAASKLRIPTPETRSPSEMIEVVGQLIDHFDVPGDLPVGVTFPGIIRQGVIGSAANLDKSWVGLELARLVADRTGHHTTIVNDADAAGFAEVGFGAARGRLGTVLVLTLGTGIGSALIHNGILVPNTELGHLEIDGYNAESRAASSIKDREGLSYADWALRLQRYLDVVEFLFSPDLIVIGGGVSKDHEEFLPLLQTQAALVPADLRNKAGIIGAALLAAQESAGATI